MSMDVNADIAKAIEDSKKDKHESQVHIPEPKKEKLY